jgi:ABC-type ATPase involved in cell division
LAGDGLLLKHEERYALTAEFLSIFRRVLAGEAVEHTGQYLEVHDARLYRPGVQKPYPELWFGGSSAAGHQVAAEHVDVYLTWGEPPADVAAKLAEVRALAAARGRTLRFGLRVHVIVRETEKEAWAAADDLIRYVTGILPTGLPDMSAATITSYVESATKVSRAPSPRPFLRVENVSKSFGTHMALYPVSLQIGRGEVVAIVGRSGSGKSTLLRLIAGLEKPGSGRILVEDEPLGAGINPRARLMFQDAALLPWLSVLENVLLATPRGPDRRRIAREALEHVGLGARERELPLVLSGGQRQRVALARALASAAELIGDRLSIGVEPKIRPVATRF